MNMMKLTGATKHKHHKVEANEGHEEHEGHKIMPPPEAVIKDENQPLHYDMLILCDSFRIDDRSRTALAGHDARSLEDFYYMTKHDFEGMVATAARRQRPLCPLQQRKLSVMWEWTQSLVDEDPYVKSGVEQAPKPAPPPLWERVRNPRLSMLNHIKVIPSREKKVEPPRDFTIIPSDWESRLKADMPMLWKQLKQQGEASTWSVWSDSVIFLRWIACGYSA